jgi:hypothetical protein
MLISFMFFLHFTIKFNKHQCRKVYNALNPLTSLKINIINVFATENTVFCRKKNEDWIVIKTEKRTLDTEAESRRQKINDFPRRIKQI